MEEKNNLQRTIVMPMDLTYKMLKDITNSFSKERKVGSGGFGEVYKGVLINGTEIAVKKLYSLTGLDDEEFGKEFTNLMMVRHKNIVRLVGYCYEIQHKPVKINGQYVLARIEERALCFEYLQRGSLDKHLSDESCGFDWLTRYKIIKGICDGLDYLHNGSEHSIYHLDLKPANILLDENIVPKIADFGLSKLFGTTQTQITEKLIGSPRYMPPEFIQKHQISNKFDVFSLGIIIIEIMAGPMGYDKYGEMSSAQQFIELVNNNWRDRIVATSKCAEDDCQQVKRCIEIAVSCIDVDRHMRPAVSDIICELKKTESHITSSSSWDPAGVAKIGLWGGAGGSIHQCIDAATPHRLESLIIFSGEVIYSIEFSYSDHSGQQHTAGPWGGHGPNKGSNRTEIQLRLFEYVTEVSGTIGPFDMAPAGVIMSLSFITNARSYGPFGDVRGTPFQIPVQSNGSIVGFFVRAGWYVDAFGVYVNPGQEMIEEEEDKATLAKIGPWGGNGGRPWDIIVATHRLESVTIHSDIVVNLLEFGYSEHDGQKHTIGPWGSHGGTACKIELGPSEFLTAVYGTTGPLFTNTPAAEDVVTSLTLVTNKRRCGPFGQGGGTPFQVPMRSNGTIVGFFGRADSIIHAIGIYANPKQGEMEQKAELGKTGPWGGSGGEAHYIDVKMEPEPHRLVSVTIRSGAIIDSLEFSYSDHDGDDHTLGPWGGPGGHAYTIELGPLELLQGISGTFGHFGPYFVITSLTFATNQCRTYGPFGQEVGTPFTSTTEGDGHIVGFFARAGSYLDALGVYTRTGDEF